MSSLKIIDRLRIVVNTARIWWNVLAKNSSGDQTKPQGTEGDVYVQFRPLCKAIEKDDLNAVRDFLRLHPDGVHTKISHFGGTALHLASASGKSEIVELLMELATEEDLRVPDINDNTALAIAAFVGATRIVECMIEKNSIQMQLPTAQDSDVRIRIPQNGHMNPRSTLARNGQGILHHAIKYRQEKIFSLIYALDTRKHLLISGTDKKKNNILHTAAMLAPPSRLASISGAALQMQRELQWYKEVENIVNPSFKEFININNEMPRQIFSDQHRQLMGDGEKWMKETATSCTVVGALIITIMFTAAFTVPGGNFEETGYPIFSHEKSFMIFIISDAISLFASSTSVLMFLGILTSRYAENDFLKSLPTKLIIGLSTLCISIAAMMVAFCATLIIMLRGELKLVIPVTLLASIPVTFFILLQFPLLVEIFVSTYGPGIF
ncbi:hypothetical protein GH714_005709 [Hevea brasiliensis]|uniref:PGG domain-containing protein n=1 Tax=Hevea brasiliensis TaxID=3981 RepID=A0A6A6MX43_HEVBR|nr:hypothetical protein GH714_005709 [Hevea brasiliensis]